MTGERILLIEDSDELRPFLAGTILTGAGFDVMTAANGVEGLALARDLQPDLIIADQQMPGMSGLAVLEALAEQQAPPPFILITAEGSEALAVSALRAGVNDYLIKPFDPAELVEAIKRTLARYWTRQIAETVPVQLYEANVQLEGRLRELDTLVEIGKRVTSALDLRQVLNRVVEAAVSLAKAEEGTLLLIDPPTGELYLYASAGHEGATRDQLRLQVSDSLAGQVIKNKKALVITGEQLQKIKTHYYFRSLIYVPLIVKEQAIGVLGVTNRDTGGDFAQHTLQLIRVLGDFASIAIDNARLFAQSEQERDTLNAILHNTEDVIIVTDEYNCVLFCNPAAREMFHVQGNSFHGKPLGEVVLHEDVQELFKREARTGRSRRSEITVDDGSIVLNAQLTIIEGVGRVAVMQDITSLKEMDRIKSEFVTTVSHDLRSPLTAILGYVELLRRTGPLNESQQQFAERITGSVSSISKLIEELLELGKIEAGFDEDREVVVLAPLIYQVAESLSVVAEKKQQRIEMEVPGDGLPPVLGHPLRLRQVIANLVENAIKYTPDEGWIRISLENNKGLLLLRIADSGIGIPKKDQPYIFDKFYRTDEAVDKFPGTGLGLSIVKSVVEAHGGRIWVNSQVGVGTTFSVMLPAYNPEVAPRD
ncbi:MAG: response regulator [Anaerolineae bacterium]|nr:response regulator [Anaerolineae bacterium]